MVFNAQLFCRRLGLFCWQLGLMFGPFACAMAQTAGLLYDPEPPVDSAYVRVLLVADLGRATVHIDGKGRGITLAPHQASDYLVLPAGSHQISLVASGKKPNTLTTQLDVVRGRAMTVAFVSDQPSVPPILFEDKTSSNRLKAMLSVYQLAVKQQAFDILTGDGATKVFSALAYGASGAIAVNPIAVELMATKAGEKVALVKASMRMSQGEAYSIFLLPGHEGKPMANVVQNKIERYTGK